MSVIEVNKLSKAYKVAHLLGKNAHPTLADDIRRVAKKPLAFLGAYHGYERESFWALKDVSFEVNRGEVVGIMGRNGSGKSTLFKILSQITYPTSGQAFIRGRIGSLLEIGTGFHPELTGRENIYFNGSVLGMKKIEIDKKFDEIVAFSEVEKFLDTPVKYYSSGMKVRLAFSVAAHIEPEILLIDEVLAVGDVKFKQKSLHKMQQSADSGTTILFVSHIVSQIEKICTRGIVLEAGAKIYDGELEKSIDKYLEQMAVATADARDEDERQIFSGDYRMSDVKLQLGQNKDGYPNLSITLKVENLKKKTEDIGIDAIFYDELGHSLAAVSNHFLQEPIKMTDKTKTINVKIDVPKFNFVPDRYNVRLSLRPSAERETIYHHIEKAASFKLPEYEVGKRIVAFKTGSPPPAVIDCRYEIS